MSFRVIKDKNIIYNDYLNDISIPLDVRIDITDRFIDLMIIPEEPSQNVDKITFFVNLGYEIDEDSCIFKINIRKNDYNSSFFASGQKIIINEIFVAELLNNFKEVIEEVKEMKTSSEEEFILSIRKGENYE